MVPSLGKGQKLELKATKIEVLGDDGASIRQPKVLVEGWYKDAQSQRRVMSAVEEVLDLNLPASYDRVRFKSACDDLYELIVSHAINDPRWAA